jgi:hypothetical protein
MIDQKRATPPITTAKLDVNAGSYLVSNVTNWYGVLVLINFH